MAACRAALTKQARKRTPLDWANTQDSLGFALEVRGERESGTARIEAAAAAYRAALEERRRERAPLFWAESFGNQGMTLALIAARTHDGALAETAVLQIEAASEAAYAGGNNTPGPSSKSGCQRRRRSATGSRASDSLTARPAPKRSPRHQRSKRISLVLQCSQKSLRRSENGDANLHRGLLRRRIKRRRAS